jgi:hypothetical protein
MREQLGGVLLAPQTKEFCRGSSLLSSQDGRDVLVGQALRPVLGFVERIQSRKRLI